MSFRRCDWRFPPSAREVSPGNRSNYKSTRERVDSKGLYGRWRLHLMGSWKIILHCRRQAGRASNDYSLIIEHILVQLTGHIGRFLHGLPTTFARNERSLFLRKLTSILVLISIFNAGWHAFSCTMGTRLKENVACRV